MAENNQLNTAWLADLTNPHHDGTTQQIDDFVRAFQTENTRLQEKVAALHQCRLKEDEVWLKSTRDPAVKQLAEADKRQDSYISAFRHINLGHAGLPDSEPTKQEAQLCEQVMKDFGFRTNEAYGAESDKILQMGQSLQAHQTFLEQIGAWQFYVKAAAAAGEVRQLLGERARTKGEFVKGEMKNARRQTDLAIAELYRVLMAMQELMPTDALNALITQLKGVERYAKQYYIASASGATPEPTPGTTPTPGGGSSEGGQGGGGGLPSGGGQEADEGGGQEAGGGGLPSGGGQEAGGGGGGLPSGGGQEADGD